jgi:6-pyruvoyltetrahydropterin/6-carboxytetrahydropterin synthase
MIRLTREVRFAVNLPGGPVGPTKVHNSYAGHPPLMGVAMWFRLCVTLEGDLEPRSQYLVNIKAIDDAVRNAAVPHVLHRRMQGTLGAGGRVLVELFEVLRGAFGGEGSEWPGARVVALELHQTPYQKIAVLAEEVPVVRLSCMFEFSAAHRLHNPRLSDEENTATFGKCNNPFGHGHNYQVQVTIKGPPDERGMVMHIPDLEKLVDDVVIRHFDHKHLNLEVPEFHPETGLIPSVENIAKVAYERLKPRLGTKLASVTVWETPKTWAEFSE